MRLLALLLILATSAHATDPRRGKAPAPPRAAIQLTRDGRSDYVIVLPENSTPVERTAANELRHYIKEVTGADLPISATSDAPKITIDHDKSLPPDAIAVKTTGRDIHLTGSLPRGPLYAVYTFLEKHVGVRWWTSTDTTIPRKPNLTIDDLDIAHTPPFRYREMFNKDAMDNPAFAARLKLNGHHHRIPEDLGGHYTLLGWCHTSFNLVSPPEYFSKHPEWFAHINGKRQGSTQLCLSNAEMRKELIKNALALVRKNPAAGIIDISQNDGYGPCECDACKAIVAEEGSESGLWMRLANEAAAEINREFPDFLVETLAYVYSRKPPKITRPSKNVLVRLCSIECDFTKPLASKSNGSFGDDLRQWSAIAPNLFIWNYVTNFSNYLIPHSNLPTLDDDLRFFADHHVVGVFQQGDAFNKTGDFLAMRTWVQSHLLWDPRQDERALRDEFLRGYYGEAAPHLAKYLDLLDAHASNPRFRLGCYNPTPNFLTEEDIQRASEFFDNALESVEPSQPLQGRVLKERIALDHVRLLRYDFAHATREQYLKDARAWITRAKSAGIVHESEGRGFDAYTPTLLGRYDRFIPQRLPPAGVELKPNQFDIQEDRFRLNGNQAKLVTDAKASNDRAAATPGGSAEWSIQFPVPQELAGPGPWNCTLVVRVDANKKRSKAFEFGLHDSAAHAYIAIDHVDLTDAGDGEYHGYTIVVDELKSSNYFWVAAPAGRQVDAVYLDRIFITKQP